MYMEDKQLICDLLANALRATRGAYDLVAIWYDDKAGTATLCFKGGGERIVNVAADSGTAMIKDILTAI